MRDVTDDRVLEALRDALAVPSDRTNGMRPTAREVLAALERTGYVLRPADDRSASQEPAKPSSARTLMATLQGRMDEALAGRHADASANGRLNGDDEERDTRVADG